MPSLLLGGCFSLNPSTSVSDSTHNNESSITNPTNVTTSSPVTTGTKPSTSTSNPTSAGTSSTSAPKPDVKIQKISAIRSEKKIGELVSFQGTYLRRIAFVHDDILFFADDTASISFRISNGIEYIKNSYRFREYKITGKLTETNGNLEVAFDSSFGTYKEAVVRLGDSEPLSYNENTTTLPISLANIGQIRERSASLTLDEKYYGYDGQLVKFTAQYAQNENENSSEKLMFLDDNDESIVVIQDGDGTGGHPLYDLRNEDNIGKYYEITGIISVRYSIPAILGLKCTYIDVGSEYENSFYVEEATEVTTEVMNKIVKGNLTSDKFSPLANEDYYKLYHAQGWVVDNPDITTTYNFGLTLTEGGSISDQGSKNTVRGFYLVNGVGIKADKLQYCPWDEYLGLKIDIYFKIESYNNNNHIWNAFVIESLLPELA